MQNSGGGLFKDTIVKMAENGESDVLVRKDPYVNLEAVIEDQLYFSANGSDRGTYSLFRMDLESGFVEELDNKKGAGGGGYFNW